jgi:glycosyltransferase involved in cell wall biosynthesis
MPVEAEYDATGAPPVRVLRMISRLNVGGPAIQVLTLTALLEKLGYRTTLVHGLEGRSEGNMNHLAGELGVRPSVIPWIRRELGLHDLRALGTVWRTFRRIRPTIVHTHAAKAGSLGRIAALLSRPRPPVLVHTFHGHVFEGVFTSKWAPRVFVPIERLLARLTTRIVAVSDEVRDDLVRYRIAPADKIEVVRLGFDLSRFKLGAPEKEALRASTREELGIAFDARVVTIVARVVQMKRVDRFISVASRLKDLEGVRFLVVGDGEQRERLEASAPARELGDRLVWAGLRHDIPAVCAATDVMVLTSDNEGTPVAFIEAQAAGLPVVGTDVGGVATVVDDRQTGRLLDRDDEAGIAQAIRDLLADPDEARRLGEAAQRHALDHFSIDRLVADIDALYRRLLRERGLPAPQPPSGF